MCRGMNHLRRGSTDKSDGSTDYYDAYVHLSICRFHPERVYSAVFSARAQSSETSARSIIGDAFRTPGSPHSYSLVSENPTFWALRDLENSPTKAGGMRSSLTTTRSSFAYGYHFQYSYSPLLFTSISTVHFIF